jgi:hypothetical protein
MKHSFDWLQCSFIVPNANYAVGHYVELELIEDETIYLASFYSNKSLAFQISYEREFAKEYYKIEFDRNTNGYYNHILSIYFKDSATLITCLNLDTKFGKSLFDAIMRSLGFDKATFSDKVEL